MKNRAIIDLSLDKIFRKKFNKFIVFKPWYKRWWGITIIILLGFCVIFTVSFISFVTWYYLQIKKETTLNNTLAQQSTVDRNLVETNSDPSAGNPDAQLVIVEFSDFTCQFCREESFVLRKILKKYQNDIKFIFRDFPNEPIHPLSTKASLAANCAFDQNKFWEYHDLLFQNQSKLTDSSFGTLASQLKLDIKRFNQCFKTEKYAQEVSGDLSAGLEAGVQATPTFFVNGLRIPGAIPENVWEEIISSYLQN
jgi:protein-disulfide isomerase